MSPQAQQVLPRGALTGISEPSLKMIIFNSGTAPVLGSALQHGKGETSFVCRDINVTQLLNYLPYKLLMRHTLFFLVKASCRKTLFYFREHRQLPSSSTVWNISLRVSGGGLGFLEMGPHLQEICLHSNKNQANTERTWGVDVMRTCFPPWGNAICFAEWSPGRSGQKWVMQS